MLSTHIKALHDFVDDRCKVERSRLAYLDTSKGELTADVYLFRLAVLKPALEEYRPAFLALLAEYPEPERLPRGPNYLEVGAALNDQRTALLAFAVGHLLGVWKVVTPYDLGVSEPAAARMAGGGMVLISGYKRPEQKPVEPPLGGLDYPHSNR